MLRAAKCERRAMPRINGTLLSPSTLEQTRRSSFACTKPVAATLTQLAAHSSTSQRRLGYELPSV